MKKSISFILLTTFILFTLFGCSNIDTPTNTPDDTTAGDNSSEPAFIDPIKDYDTIDETSAEGFVIKSKKYDYEDNNVVIMNVENRSENNYTVTVDMTYYDDGGNKITKESQSFEGFSASWSTYFLFKPDKAFSNYEYKLTTKEYVGECYGNTFTFKYGGFSEGEVPFGWGEPGIPSAADGKVKSIYGDFYVRYEYSEMIDFWVTSVFFDNGGDIYYISTMHKYGYRQPYTDHSVSDMIIKGTADSVDWPEELKGDTNGILILNNIGIGITKPEY